jgi:hypothetical protein
MDTPVPPPLAHLHDAFLAMLPRIELHGRIFFRHLKCPASKEDSVQEMTALAWAWFVRLARRGKDPTAFPSALATFAARAVHNGRRACGQERDQDVLSPRAQRRRGFAVAHLPTSTARRYEERYGRPRGQRHQDAWEEALADNTRTPPDEQAAFRLDFAAWLHAQTDRKRRLIVDLMAGERTKDVSQRHGLSPGRISQLRRELRNDWRQFCAAPEPASPRHRV